MVNVDDAILETIRELATENLHVASQNHEINLVFSQKFERAFLLLLPRRFRNWNEVIRDSERGNKRF